VVVRRLEGEDGVLRAMIPQYDFSYQFKFHEKGTS